MTKDVLEHAQYEIRQVDHCEEESSVSLIRNWYGNIGRSRLVNEGERPVAIKEICLFKGSIAYKPGTEVYGEGYSMLSQYAGSVSMVNLVGIHGDEKHYKMHQTEGFTTVYNLLMLHPIGEAFLLMAFSSCRRFNGEFRLGENSFEVVLAAEGISIEPGESWELEEFVILSGNDRDVLLEQLADRIQMNQLVRNI